MCLMNRESFAIVVWLLAILAGCGFQPRAHAYKDMRAIEAAVAASHRPRVVFFFASWCGACHSYGPKLKKAVDTYGNCFDFESLNVDDPDSRKLWEELHVHSVPVTCFFDRVGTPVYECSGCLNDQQMNRVLRDIYVENQAVDYDNSGWSYAQHGQYQKAIIDLTKAINFDSKLDKAYKNRGWCYGQLGQYTKALDDFNKAIDINPKYAKAYYGRGEVFEKLGKADLAEKDKTKGKELGYVAPKSK
jgi:tetratricopeptide (TPR) repeat protein